MTEKLKVELTLKEASVLAQHLSGLIAKGSISTTPYWARRIVHKIWMASREQYPQEAHESRQDQTPS